MKVCTEGKCSCTVESENSVSGDGEVGGRVVAVVGVKLDSKSKELLTWALVKVAQPGDHVLALHVLHPNSEKSEPLSLVKSFDSMLAAYEGFCNLKQVHLKLKVCRGSPVRKVLAREAKLESAVNLIIGSSGSHHAIRSSVSLAKYCARKVTKSISVIAVDNGKIVYQREATASVGDESSSDSDVPHSRFKRRKTLTKSPLSLTPKKDSCTPENNRMALVPVKTIEVPESKSRWTLLQRVFLHNIMAPEKYPGKRSSVMQWVWKRPSRQDFAAIYPDHKQNVSDKDEPPCTNLDEEKGAIIPVGSDDNPISDECFVIFPEELKGLSERYSPICRLFSYQELCSATSDFLPENLIGKGGSSKVYKGCLPDGKQLAVKILKPSEAVAQQFRSEIEILTTLHHRHIISLFGFCLEENNLLLVYDLLSRGSLEENLHGSKKDQNSFSWEDRYKVALGVAEALDHLHNAADGPIIHRDVKSSNILLSDDSEPQLSDFGLATLASSCPNHLDSIDVAGTFGYLAPEYFMHGKITEKIDVYAFGVVLLELLSGKKPIDNGNEKGQESLVMWAKQILKGGNMRELLDPSLIDAYDHDQFEIMVLAASLCIRRAPGIRPQIDIVVKLLQGEAETIKWAREEGKASEEVDSVDGEQQPSNIQSFINLALLNLEDESSLSCNSTGPTISVEDYLQGRFSRSSSFD
ncbi:protein kinase STUNTED-like [Lycium barbarum]|uniref:protein kinase STUNTED-like n=1 Tax=Lycium barbarum TaxID=112863 RepID=UPI00293F0003|nr:protein kinase STUNTED-like [Lycium barbarum]